MVQPADYEFPSDDDIQWLFENTRSDDSLRKLLVDAHTTEYDIVGPDEHVKLQLEDFPLEFVQDCLIFSPRLISRFGSRLACRHCGPAGDRLPCNSDEHKPQPFEPLDSTRWCQYHEHGDNDAEKEICKARRAANEWKFKDPQ